MGNLKIFLSYHRKTPIYKSDIFEPVQAGAALSDIDLGISRDDSGDNISRLNPYYCELSVYYYVLKNYIDNCEEKYIGFAHYRRLPDLTKISDVSVPSIFGLNYSNSVKVFNSFGEYDITSCCNAYDIILPCKAYMYKDTVNPTLKSDEPVLNMREQFRAEHNNNLLDILEEVIKEKYPNYSNAVEYCYNKTSAHFYNIYIMKKEILKEFLSWEFELLYNLGEKIGGWEQEKYERMAGFVGERLINIWLEAHKQSKYKLGYVPVYMIDFESEYIENANAFNFIGRYDLAQKELQKLYKCANNKFDVSSAILKTYLCRNDLENAFLYIPTCLKDCKTADDYNNLAQILQTNKNEFRAEILQCYRKSCEICKCNKLFAQNLLTFSTGLHDMELIYQAWQIMLEYELTDYEKSQYEKFLNCYKLVHNND